jgi:hypothetical protein
MLSLAELQDAKDYLKKLIDTAGKGAGFKDSPMLRAETMGKTSFIWTPGLLIGMSS